MPRIYSPVSELDTHVVLPVATQITHKIVNDLNYKYILGDRIYIDTGWTTTKNQKINHVMINKQNLLKVAVELSHPANMKWDIMSFRFPTGYMIQSPHIKDIFPDILVDTESRIILKEMILPMNMTLNGTMVFQNRDEAYEFQSLMYRRFSNGMVFTEIISYDYPIPNDVLSMIFSLYKLKEFDKPTSFRSWMNKCKGRAVDFNVNRTNSSKELVIKKMLLNPLITIEYTQDKPNEIKRNRGPMNYECNFTVSLQFQQPDMVTLEYPCVIDNKLTPANMIVTDHESDQPINSLDAPYPLKILEAQMHQENNVKGYEPYLIQCPYYDTWQIPWGPLSGNSYIPFFITMFLLEENEDKNSPNRFKNEVIVDLNGDLGDGYELHPIIKYILKEQGNESFLRNAIFNISVFSNNTFIEPSKLSIDENLKLTITVDQNIHSERRIVISECSRIINLHSKWFKYLQDKKIGWFFRLGVIMRKIAKKLNIDISDLTYNKTINLFGGSENDPSWAFRFIKNTIYTRK